MCNSRYIYLYKALSLCLPVCAVVIELVVHLGVVSFVVNLADGSTAGRATVVKVLAHRKQLTFMYIRSILPGKCAIRTGGG